VRAELKSGLVVSPLAGLTGAVLFASFLGVADPTEPPGGTETVVVLGTVIGIIRSFGALGADIGTQRYTQLSHGISEALFNTAAGLAIGIPTCYIFSSTPSSQSPSVCAAGVGSIANVLSVAGAVALLLPYLLMIARAIGRNRVA